jgi:predicted ATPase
VQLVRKINWKLSKFSTVTSEVQSGGKLLKKRRTRTLIIPTVDVRGDELSFNQLSEGTFRALALLYYVMHGSGDLLLLEEPEVCIHHGLLNSVVSVIREYSRDRQIILSTHSDLVVDMLKPEDLRLVRDINAKGTRVTTVSQSMTLKGVGALKEYLRTSGTLGEYWKHSGFER